MYDKRGLFVFLVCWVIAFSVVCNSQDKRITKEVESKFLADNVLSSAKIDVSSQDGKVQLDGKVIGQSEADRAIQLARTVSGVHEVESHLQIDTHITNKDIKQRVEQGQDAAKKQNKDQSKPQ